MAKETTEQVIERLKEEGCKQAYERVKTLHENAAIVKRLTGAEPKPDFEAEQKVDREIARFKVTGDPGSEVSRILGNQKAGHYEN